MKARIRAELSALLFTALLSLLAAGAAQAIQGDVNGDGAVDGVDALLTFQHTRGKLTLSAEQRERADVHPLPGTGGRVVGDGQVTEEDAARLLRHLVGLIPRGELAGEFDGPRITGFEPESGGPGTRVTLRGVGFVSGSLTENVLRLAGAAAPVVSATATEVVVEVPPGAQSGRFTITTPGGTSSSQQEFVVTENRGGKITPPAGMPARGFLVVSPYSDAQTDDQGRFQVAVGDEVFAFVSAHPGSGGENALWGFYYPGTGELAIDARSTAISLLLMHPSLMPGPNTPPWALVDTVAGLPETRALTQAIEQTYPSNASPLDDHAFLAVYAQAINAALAALPPEEVFENQVVRQPSAAHRYHDSGLRQRELDLRKTYVQVRGGVMGKTIEVGNRWYTPVDWFYRVARLDPTQFEKGAEDINILIHTDRLRVYRREKPLATGIVGARGLFNVLNFFSYVGTGVLNALGVSAPSDPVLEQDGLYIVRSFSGALRRTDPAEQDFLAQLPDGASDDATGFALNLSGLMSDVFAAFVSFKSQTVKEKAAALLANALVRKLSQKGITDSNGNRTPGGSSRVAVEALTVLELVCETLPDFIDAMAQEFGDQPWLKKLDSFAKTLAKSWNIASKISSVGRVGERVTSLAGLHPWASVTPLETAIVTVGDPFALRITSYPNEVVPGEEVTFRVQGLPKEDTTSKVKVYLGGERIWTYTVDATATEIRATVPRTLALGGKISIFVKAPTGETRTPREILVTRSPVIESVSPAEGFAANPNPPQPFKLDDQGGFPGTQVTLSGRYFDPTKDKENVFFPGGVKAVVTQMTRATIVCNVPQGATGTGPIVIKVGDKEYPSPVFEVFGTPALHPPLDPTRGTSGTTVVVDGVAFGNDAQNVRVLVRKSDIPESEETAAIGPLSSTGGPSSLTATIGLTTSTEAGAVGVDLRVLTPAGATDWSTGAFTLEPGRVSGAQLRINTIQDNVIQDDFLSLREAILLMTTGNAGHPLTDAEKKQIYVSAPGQYVPGVIPGPSAADQTGWEVSGTVVLQSPLPAISGGSDSIGLAVDASALDLPPILVTSEGNSVTFSVTGAKAAACEVTANNNKLFAKAIGCRTGVLFKDASSNVLWGNVAGYRLEGNGCGIEITGKSVGNRIEGPLVLSQTDTQQGWPGVGIWIHGEARGNSLNSCRVQGNASHGILISENAHDNTVQAGFIWSNKGDGVRIEGAGASGNVINGSVIGVTKTGATTDAGVSLANGGNGVTITGGAKKNVVGVDTDKLVWPTLIANNGGHGIAIIGGGTDHNVVANCLVGLPDTGNKRAGIAVLNAGEDGPEGTRVFRNEIGGNGEFGILVSAGPPGLFGATSIHDNSVGVFTVLYQLAFANAAPSTPAPDGWGGLRLEAPARRAIVEKNRIDLEPTGIVMVGASEINLRENQVSLSPNGGVQILANTHDVTMEGDTVSGSGDPGILFENAGNSRLLGVKVKDGLSHGIVLKMSRGIAVKAQPDALFGALLAEVTGNAGDGIRVEAGCSFTDIAGQRITGNAGSGVAVTGPNTDLTSITECLIGDKGKGNVGDGVRVEASAASTFIGSPAASYNYITGNRGWGVHLAAAPAGAASAENGALIQHNFIGTDGVDAVANVAGGVLIEDDWRSVFIGGPGKELGLPGLVAAARVADGNFICGNGGPGIQAQGARTAGIFIDNNQIGIGVLDTPLPNVGPGVLIQTGVADASVGRSRRNVICANKGAGIYLLNLNQPVVHDNLIGLDQTGTGRLGNEGDGLVLDGVRQALVESNRLVNNRRGIVLMTPDATGNQIVGNVLGLGTANQRLGQRGTGIEMVGGARENVLRDNVVTLCGGAFGIALGAGTDRNTMLGGSVFGNEAGGIAAANPPAPKVTVVRPALVVGEVPTGVASGSLIQIYADGDQQGRHFLGQTRVRGRTWLLHTSVPPGMNVTATVTDASGNTSAFGVFDPTAVPPPLPPPAPGTDPADAPLRGQQLLAFSSTRDGNAEIYSRTPGDEADRRLTNHPAADHTPALSPDAGRAAFVSERSGNPEIWVMNSDGSDPVRLTDHAAPDYDPAWSPDGTRILFVSERDGDPEVYVMNADGTNVTRLTASPRADRHPCWSPDSTRIAFTSERSGNPDVWVMNADGSDPVRVTDHASADYDPAWSPDGARLAFVSEREGGPGVYLVGVNGSSVSRLSPAPDADVEPAWSPDGEWVAFTSAQAGDAEIFARQVGTGRTERLTVSLGANGQAAWATGR
ncbi:MAG: PD40 domain-containing protein [Armatimonadetes bacterium]|nr:PD40 domain-containing protein [Armatimonadota bacterium]